MQLLTQIKCFSQTYKINYLLSIRSWIIEFSVRYDISLTKTHQFFFWPSGCVKCLFVFVFFSATWVSITPSCVNTVFLACPYRLFFFFGNSILFIGFCDSKFLITRKAARKWKWRVCWSLALEMHCTLPVWITSSRRAAVHSIRLQCVLLSPLTICRRLQHLWR